MNFRIFILTFLLLNSLVWSADQIVKIGVLAKRGEAVTLKKWSDTATYLSKEIENYKFRIIPLDFDALSKAVKNNTIDFVVTNTAYYVELEYLYGISRIATLKNSGLNKEVLIQFGGVIFTRHDSPINSLQELKNTSFGAVDQNSFGGWIMAKEELAKKNIVEKDLKTLKFFNSHDNVVKAVISKEVDAGTVRSDTLERMANEKLIKLADLKILAEKHYPDFPYKVSTALYPEWPFAKLSKTSDKLTNKVIVALLKMEATSQAAKSAKIAGWTAPLDYSKVHHVMQKLHISPYQAATKKLEIVTYKLSISDYFDIVEAPFFIAILIVIVFIIYKYLQDESLLNINLSMFNIALIVFELGVIFFFIYQVVKLDRLEHDLAQLHDAKYKMTQVADRLRQSSDEQTQFARAYTVTGDKELKQRYFTTLGIRNGDISRPKDYDALYWDLHEAIRSLRHPKGEKIALRTLIESLPFTQYEREALTKSEKSSNELVNIETEAFKMMENRKQQKAIQSLYSNKYYNAKHNVMLPIDEMMEMLKARTKAESEYLNQMVTKQIHLLIMGGFLFIIGNIIIYFLLRKKVNAPVEYLTSVIKKFETGDQNIEKKNFYNDEIGYMIERFFDMYQLLEESKQEVETLLSHMQHSVNYAALIQSSLLPKENEIKQYFDEYFMIWEPKDVVGGDIIIIEELNNKDELLIMVIDCTGHGIPGALMTVLVKAIQRQMVATIKRTGEDVSPAKLLSIFNSSIKHMLHQDSSETRNNVGFDGAILYYNKHKNLLRYAGANVPLFSVKNKELTLTQPDKESIGYKKSDASYEFTDHNIIIDSELTLYLSTDGFLDQNGGEHSFPYGKDRFIEALKQFNQDKMENQRANLLDELTFYQGTEDRNDDIAVFAFKVHPYEVQ